MTTAAKMINETHKHGQNWDHESWWEYRGRLFRVVIHTDPSYPRLAGAHVDMLTEAGWTQLTAFNPSDFGENSERAASPSFVRCWVYAETAAILAADALAVLA